MSSASRVLLLQTEVKRLENELKTIQTQWNKRHYLFGFILLTIPAHFLLGKVYAVIGVLCTPALYATQSYLLYIRRNECRELIAEALRDIKQIEASAKP
jgi:hypothetical protein